MSNRNKYTLSVKSVAASPRSRREGAAVVSRSTSGSGSVVDLSGYMTREEFARYFELVNVGTEASPVTAIHALYAGLYSDGFVSGFGSGEDSDPAGGSVGIDEDELAAYLLNHSYATQPWVLAQGFLKVADMANYVTLTTQQTISGQKTFGAPVTASSFVKSGGAANQVLMADGSVQTHWKAADVTTATSDDGMITPLAMRNWTASQYQPKGNYVTLDTEQIISAPKTFSALLTLTTGFKLGGILFTYDAVLNAIKIDGNVYSTGFLSGYGPGTEGESSIGGASALAMLTDVQLSTPTAGQSLVYDGAKWVNQTVKAGVDSSTLAGYVTLNTAQTITGEKTFTADIKMTGTGSLGNKIHWGRNTDSAQIFFKNDSDADTDSYLGFKTGDNGNEYFRFSHLSGGTESVWATIKSAGITANSFIKSEGTSNQFLKADGSVDSSTYLTSHQALDYINNLGLVTAISGTTTFASGLRLYKVYNNGYPTTYGNLLRIGGSGFGELLCGWAADSSVGALYYRSKRDVASTEWSAWATLLTTANYTSILNSSYVKKSGDTMTGNLNINSSGWGTQLNIKRTDSDTGNIFIRFYTATEEVGRIGIDANKTWVIAYPSGESKIWHASNDGAGSGLDADLLDGYEGSVYLRSFWTNNPGFDCDTFPQNSFMSYTYANHAPFGGPVAHLGVNSYGFYLGTPAGADGALYYRRHGSAADGGMGSWQQLARITDNVASATKLATSRTIWGQSFNGEANVSGRWELNGVASGALSIFDGSTYRAFQSHQSVPLCLNPIGNNVAIGKTTADYKLDVLGSASLSSSDTGAGGDVSLQLWRGTNASWRLLNQGGTLKFQNNYTSSVGNYFDCLTLDYNTGNASFKGSVKIGSGIISWDATNAMFKFSHGLYSEGVVTGFGTGSGSGDVGGVMGNITIEPSDGSNPWVKVVKGNRDLWLHVGSTGTAGLWSGAFQKWLISLSADGTTAQIHTGYFKAPTISATAFQRDGSSDLYMLLGGGGHKLLTSMFTGLSVSGSTLSVTVGGTTKTATLPSGGTTGPILLAAGIITITKSTTSFSPSMLVGVVSGYTGSDGQAYVQSVNNSAISPSNTFFILGSGTAGAFASGAWLSNNSTFQIRLQNTSGTYLDGRMHIAIWQS